jgi:hypothetical protein
MTTTLASRIVGWLDSYWPRIEITSGIMVLLWVLMK